MEGIVRVMRKAPEKKTGADGLPIPPYAVYKICGGQPKNLLDLVNILQEELVPMQPGDVPTTYADASALERDLVFTPKVTLREELREFAKWDKEYYQ